MTAVAETSTELVFEEWCGYRRVRSWPFGGDVLIHRLCAVAWFGWDAVIGKDVHHRIPVNWLNVESNLLPLPSEEHGHLTGFITREGVPDSVVRDVVRGFGNG